MALHKKAYSINNKWNSHLNIEDIDKAITFHLPKEEDIKEYKHTILSSQTHKKK